MPQSEEAEKKPGKRQATKKVKLIPVKVLSVHKQSALVEYELDDMPYRCYVDTNDIVEDGCPLARLQDAPCGITWEFDIQDIARTTELELKRAQIWTYEDLQEKDRQIIRIATNVLGKAIWTAAKRGRNRRQ